MSPHVPGQTQFFLCYARRDLAFAQQLVAQLRAAGERVWYDIDGISGGQRWDDAVQAALERSDGMIAILSPNSVDSQNCKDEVGYALDNDWLVVPVLLAECNVPLRLRRIQRFSFSGDLDAVVRGVLDTIRQDRLEEAPVGSVDLSSPPAAVAALPLPRLAGALQWHGPVPDEKRPGYAALHHVTFVLADGRSERASANIEVVVPDGRQVITPACIPNGYEMRHEWRALDPREQFNIPVIADIATASPFWLDRRFPDARAHNVLTRGTYILDHPFLDQVHRAPLQPGRYRVRVVLALGDRQHRAHFESDWKSFTALPPEPLKPPRAVVSFSSSSLQSADVTSARRSGMGLGDWFSTFNSNLQIKDGGTISTRYKNITKRLNTDFWNTTSDTAHSLYVGSYGRNTAIEGISDLDVLMQLPYEVYKQYDAHTGNGQSALLQAVKTSIEKTYSTTSIKADGQVILVPFNDGITFEVVPGFSNKDDSYTFPNANDGGSWKTTNPKPEIEAIRSRNVACNYNLIPLCRMARAWKNQWSVPIGGLLIDTLAYQFIENYQYRDKSYLYYDYMCRDFFKWMADQDEKQEWWRAPGSGQWVYGKGLFQYKAKRAYNLALEAITHETADPKREWSAKQKWREVFGTAFPD